jgi:hypothetical protein
LKEFLCRIGIESALVIVEKDARFVGKLLLMWKVLQAEIKGKLKHAIAFLLSRA